MIQLYDPCDICGDIGFVEDIVTCFHCKTAREHGCGYSSLLLYARYCMREVLLAIPEIWFCEECRLSTAIVSPESVVVENVPMSSISITSESVSTSSVLKLPRKSVDHKNEIASKSNNCKTSGPSRFLMNQNRSDSACKHGAATVGNVKKISCPSKSEHLVRNLVSSLDQSSTMATVFKNVPPGFKAAPAKPSVNKIKESHDHKKIGLCSAKLSSTTQQKANQTSKILKDKKTSGTCEKGTHDTFMPGKKIETSQSRHGDSEEVSPGGLSSLPVNTIASTLTESDLEKMALEYQIDTNRYHLSLPKPYERANSYFPCKRTFCIYADAFKAGFRLPPHPLIPEILNEFGLAPTQIPPNSWRVLVCFISFCYSQKITPTVNLFRAICSLKDTSGDSKGWWFFSARIGFKLFEGFPNSIKGWRNRFFIISTSERDTLGFNTKWGPPKSAANLSPTLSAVEFKSLDDLFAAATNNSPDVRVLLSEEALVQAGISSTLLKSKESEETKQRQRLSQSGLVRALKRKRTTNESGKSTCFARPCQELTLGEVCRADQPEKKRPKESQQPMGQSDLSQPTELTDRPQEINPLVTSAPLAPYDLPREVLPQQACPQSNVQRIAGASAPTVSYISATDHPPSPNAEVMHTGSVEYTREQSVFTHPALARELIGRIVLPHDCDFVAHKDPLDVAHKDPLDMAQELMCQAMKSVTWAVGVSQKLIEMHHEIHKLKGERNVLRAELESEKTAVSELESARKEVERLGIRLKETEEKARTREDQFAKLKIRLKQAEVRAASAERKVVVSEEKLRQSEIAKSRIAEETLKNFKVSEEFQHEVEDYHAEAYGMGLNVAIEKIKKQFPDLDISMIDFYSED